MYNEDDEDIPDGQRPLLEEPPVEWPGDDAKTGDESVDSILGQLQGLPRLPTAAHTEAYAQVHEELLAELDAGGDSD